MEQEPTRKDTESSVTNDSETTARIRRILNADKPQPELPSELQGGKDWQPAKSRLERLTEAREQIAKIRQNLHGNNQTPPKP